jgi:hypothetical protein
MYARIIYPDDTDVSNNDAQHNLDIQQTHSSARSQVVIMNGTVYDLLIQFEIAEQAELAAARWEFSASQSSFEMYRRDCPVQIEMVLTQSAGRRNVRSVRRFGNPRYTRLGSLRYNLRMNISRLAKAGKASGPGRARSGWDDPPVLPPDWGRALRLSILPPPRDPAMPPHARRRAAGRRGRDHGCRR